MDRPRRLDVQAVHKAYEYASPYRQTGKVISSRGLLCEVGLTRAVIGSSVEFRTGSGGGRLGEVVGIGKDRCLAMPYGEVPGLGSETRVELGDLSTSVRVGPGLLGRVVDFRCEPIDGKGPIDLGGCVARSVLGERINPLDRPQIDEPLDVGIHAINGFMTLGKGQRVAVMAGSGVGKSSILGMIARNTEAHVNVIALVGERGREVLEFIEDNLTGGAMARTVVVVATSEESPLVRAKAAYVATAVAEHFRDEGGDVLFMMDSITRFAMACREVSLGLGEIPGQKGYTPSVFSRLPRLLERAGRTARGTITGIYAVLVEGNDMDEPITDAVRAISDGHVVLSRELASRNHFPAIDVLQSVSRVMHKVVPREHRVVASYLRELLATHRENEDLINAGAYVKGSNAKIDKALAIHDDLAALTRQPRGDEGRLGVGEVFDRFVEVARKAEAVAQPPSDGEAAA